MWVICAHACVYREKTLAVYFPEFFETASLGIPGYCLELGNLLPQPSTTQDARFVLGVKGECNTKPQSLGEGSLYSN